MNTYIHSTEIETTSHATSYAAAYAPSYREGLERFFELSKSSLDLLVAQNAEFLASYQQVIQVPPFFQPNLADTAFRGYATLQKNLLDLAFGQSSANTDGSRRSDNSDLTAKAPAQQTTLDSVAMQATSAGATMNQQSGFGGSPAHTETDLDSVQLRMLAKEIVDFATIPLITKSDPSVN